MPPTNFQLILLHELSLKPHGGVWKKNVQVDQNEINPFHNRKRNCIKITHKRENQETNIGSFVRVVSLFQKVLE